MLPIIRRLKINPVGVFSSQQIIHRET